ncbi:MAG: hypothetical protein LBL76_07195 [Treponema sp.]|jgi:hypothetical protein|nr:hypothetical protein [Treponema sp.]
MSNNEIKPVFSGKTTAYRIISVCALLFMALFMTVFASKQSFWLDELDWMIGIITGKSVFNNKIFTGMFQILLEQGYNLPLYYLIEIPFYYLLPYGETFLLIPSIVFVILGIAILSRAGKLIGGEDIGFFTLCVSVTSSTLIIQGGWEIRPYSISFCFSALTFLMFIKRLQVETKKNIACYGMALLLLLYSHWFGSILAIFYGFTDLYLCIKKKISFKCLLAYMFAGMLFLPWFCLMVFHHANDLGDYWAQIPRIIEPVLTIRYLLSNTVTYCLLFAAGFFIITIRWIQVRHKARPLTVSIWLFMIAGIIWTIVPIFIYSRFINRSGSFYVSRYFFVIMPFVFLIVAYTISEIYAPIVHVQSNRKKQIFYVVIILWFCFIGFQNYRRAYLNITAIHEPYRETAEYVSKDRRIYEDDSLILSSSGSAWIEYYFNKRGYTIPCNVAVYTKKYQTVNIFITGGVYREPLALTEDQLLTYKHLYLFEVHECFPEEYMRNIEKNYPLLEEIPGFSPAPLVSSGLATLVKNTLGLSNPQAPAPVPFGLRLYSRQ